jgi:hypothetical protein
MWHLNWCKHVVVPRPIDILDKNLHEPIDLACVDEFLDLMEREEEEEIDRDLTGISLKEF